jgi:hypothetical protein
MFFLYVVTFSRNSCILRFKWSHTYQIMLLTEMFLPSYKILNIFKINSLFNSYKKKWQMCENPSVWHFCHKCCEICVEYVLVTLLN